MYLNIRVRVETKLKHYDGYALGVQYAGQDDLGSVPCVEDYDGRDEGQWEDLGRKFGRGGSLSLPISFLRLPTMCDQHKIICTMMALIVVPALFIVRLWNDTL